MNGLDTNVLVRYLVQDDVEQARRAARYIESGASYVNCVVLCELVWVLESAYGYPQDTVAGVLEKILMTSDFQVEDRDLAWAALNDYRRSKADYADCLIARRNQAAGCKETASFDKRTKGVAGFRAL
ncbi:MAG: type II toxin-antitoxin system VapC family toxin [Pseudomonadota bacterium]|jgi:predicted nucleic-acid-binding protein